MQSAYQVLVASSPELLAQNKGDQWDSGKTASDDSTQVVYNGKPLESDHSYWWKVRYWDKDGNASDYSHPASFDVALLSADDWKGQWIGGANQLRKEIHPGGSSGRARAYVYGARILRTAHQRREDRKQRSRPCLDHLSISAFSIHLRRHLASAHRRERFGA